MSAPYSDHVGVGAFAPYLGLFARTIIGGILLVAGVLKLSERHRFVEIVRNYDLLPQSLTALVGRSLPIVEIIVSLGLLLALLEPWSELSAMCLFILFAGAISVNLLRGRKYIPCGCFGPAKDRELNWSLVIRNIMLAGLAAAAIFVPNITDSVVRLSPRQMIATVVIAATTLASWSLGGVIRQFWRLPNLADGHRIAPQTYQHGFMGNLEKGNQ